MPDLDETLDMLLREHLCAELNGQLGRPAAAFLAHTVEAARTVDATRADGNNEKTGGSAARLIGSPAAPVRFGGFNTTRSNSHRFNGWFIGMAGAALAASIAALWAAPAAFRRHEPVIPIRATTPDVTVPREFAKSDAITPDGSGTADVTGQTAPQTSPQTAPQAPPQSPLLQWVQRRTLDEGTVVLDAAGHPVPARKLRQQQLEHLQWYDAAKRTQVEMTVPRENIKFVGMDTY